MQAVLLTADLKSGECCTECLPHSDAGAAAVNGFHCLQPPARGAARNLNRVVGHKRSLRKFCFLDVKTKTAMEWRHLHMVPIPQQQESRSNLPPNSVALNGILAMFLALGRQREVDESVS